VVIELSRYLLCQLRLLLRIQQGNPTINLTFLELIVLDQSILNFKKNLVYIVQSFGVEEMVRQGQQLAHDFYRERQLVHEKLVILPQLCN
jgi:hypothetical protein